MYQATKKEGDSDSSAITHISIPYDVSDELSDSESCLPQVSGHASVDTGADHDYSEIHDVLFNSVGLERVYECWQKVQKKYFALSFDDDFQMFDQWEVPGFSRCLQDELVEAYFGQFHPICPAVDQSRFLKWYEAPQRDVLAPPQPMRLLLLSILFAALSHIEEDSLRGELCTSVKRAQKTLFYSAQSLYHQVELDFMGTEELAQSALLLSYWSPYDSKKEVNSYWVDEAIRHAVAGGMSDPSSTHRKRIIWWCCIIRNHESSGCYLISVETKLYFTRAFILLCKLTRLMVDSVRLNSRDYNSTWLFPGAQQAFDLLQEVGQIDQKLKVWGANFAHLYAAVQDLKVPSTDLVIFHLLELMHQFAISMLYEPFLRLSDSCDSQAWFVKDLALLKIKEASRNTAAITASMLRFANPKDLSIIVPPWIILPIALHLIQLSEAQDLEVKTEITQQLGYLMRTLHTLTRRFEGAQFIVKIINAIIMLVRNSTEEVPLGQPFAWLGTPQGRSVGRGYMRLRQETVILHVLETIQNGLANEVVQA
ncbi:Fungal specific transcription factor domain-containing protein isoform 2 [Cladophialophora immunda]|nr:Fungal specific transcription factor domain-containing protein isoform 1 [Cladophialophora immunda]OQU94848.1 Fungal specific transcription factor domain-containing protein isoform 2 [Cladophialophora immunda]